MPITKNMPILAKNKRATYDYEILDKFEAGIKLTGQEVKSAKNGRVNLKGSYVTVSNGRPHIINMHIAKYDKAGAFSDYDPYRTRELLLNKKEIDRLIGKKDEQGLTLIPLSLYTKRGKIKLEFGIGRGKKKHDKREDIKKKDTKRRIKKEYGV